MLESSLDHIKTVSHSKLHLKFAVIMIPAEVLEVGVVKVYEGFLECSGQNATIFNSYS